MGNQLMFHCIFSWGLESSNLCNNERGNMLLEVSGTAELRPPEAGRELNPIPPTSLLHGWLCSSDLPRVAAVPGADRP